MVSYFFVNIPNDISSAAINNVSVHNENLKVTPLTIDATPLKYKQNLITRQVEIIEIQHLWTHKKPLMALEIRPTRNSNPITLYKWINSRNNTYNNMTFYLTYTSHLYNTT